MRRFALSSPPDPQGRRLTALNPVPLSPRARAGRIAFWVIAGIATLLAGVNIISYA